MNTLKVVGLIASAVCLIAGSVGIAQQIWECWKFIHNVPEDYDDEEDM